MFDHLNYEIGGHRIVVHTPDLLKTTAMLPAFYPFISFRFYEESDDFLFALTGNQIITIPEAALEDKLEFSGRLSHVYRTAEGIFVSLKIENIVRHIHISSDLKNVFTDLTLINSRERPFLQWFMVNIFGLLSSRYQTVKIHASVTELNGKALIFLGKSGTGKSTHSRLWRKYIPNSTLLNDDEPIIRVCDDGIVRVYGTPWSGSTPCYRNQSARVAAFVHLYRNSENRLTELSKMEALSSLFSSTAFFRSDSENSEMSMNTITKILERIPVYRLDCRPDREAVMLTKTLM